MKPLTLALALFTTLAATACGGAVQVAHRTGLEASAHTHRSYAVTTHPVNRGELDTLVAESLHGIMAERGYARAESAEADLHVSFGVLLEDTRGAAHDEVVSSDLADRPDAPARTKTLVVMLSSRVNGEVVWMGTTTSRAADSELRAHTATALEEIAARIPRAAR